VTRPAAVHYLRSNKGEQSPHRLLIVDAEARSEPADGRELQTLRCWAARLVVRHGRASKQPDGLTVTGTEAGELVDLVESLATSAETTWLYTHNLSYDLVLTRLPLLMLARGWQLGKHNLASEAPWALMKIKSKSVRLADSWSWLPVAVKTLGQAQGQGKPDLPADDATEAQWLARCVADLDITATAICRLMAEWDWRQLGWWSITGPATGWNSMLHMAPASTKHQSKGPAERDANGSPGRRRRSPVIDPDPTGRAFERQAVYSGRRDVWRRGLLPGGPYVDLDFKSAHLAVCASMLLPSRRVDAFDSLDAGAWQLRAPRFPIIAECVVETQTPRYPLRYKNAVLHPVGRFQTTLCGPEIQEAQARGELCSVGKGYSYGLSDHMATWARWAWKVLYPDAAADNSPKNGPDTSSGPTTVSSAAGVDPFLQIAVKGWSRTVPGRWAMLTSRTLRAGPNALGGWSLEPMLIGSPPKRGALVRLGETWSEEVRDQEADDSFPAVLAFIQSHVRVLLNRAIDRLGPGAVFQCNTDSILVSAARLIELAMERADRERDIPSWDRELDMGAGELSQSTYPLAARIKSIAERVVVRSPQHLRLDSERKYAGVPNTAVEIEPETFRFWTWPKLAGQMERGDPRGYIREVRTMHLGGLTVNRWAYTDGCCEPVTASWSPVNGSSRLHSPETDFCRHGAALSPSQHPILRSLL
jgi:hypothetical protein